MSLEFFKYIERIKMEKNTQNVLLAWSLIGLVMFVMYSSMNYIWSALEIAK